MAFRDQVTALQARVEALERELAEKDALIERLERDPGPTKKGLAERVLKTNKRLRDELEAFQALGHAETISNLEAQLDDTKQALDRGDARIAELLAESAEARQRHEAEVATLRAEIAVLHPDKDGLLAEIRSKSALLTKAERDIERLNVTGAGWKRKYEALQRQLNELQELWSRINGLLSK